MRSFPRWLQVVLVATLFVWMLNQPLASLLVDWWWFESLGYDEIFVTSLTAKAGLFFVGFLIAGGFLGANVWFCERQSSIDAFRLAMLIPDAPLDPRRVLQLVRGLMVAAVLAPAMVLAAAATAEWFQLLCFLEAEDFGTADPLYLRDVGFYVFRLPLLVFAQTWATATVSLTIFSTSAALETSPRT